MPIFSRPDPSLSQSKQSWHGRPAVPTPPSLLSWFPFQFVTCIQDSHCLVHNSQQLLCFPKYKSQRNLRLPWHPFCFCFYTCIAENRINYLTSLQKMSESGSSRPLSRSGSISSDFAPPSRINLEKICSKAPQVLTICSTLDVYLNDETQPWKKPRSRMYEYNRVLGNEYYQVEFSHCNALEK